MVPGEAASAAAAAAEEEASPTQAVAFLDLTAGTAASTAWSSLPAAPSLALSRTPPRTLRRSLTEPELLPPEDRWAERGLTFETLIEVMDLHDPEGIWRGYFEAYADSEEWGGGKSWVLHFFYGMQDLDELAEETDPEEARIAETRELLSSYGALFAVGVVPSFSGARFMQLRHGKRRRLRH